MSLQNAVAAQRLVVYGLTPGARLHRDYRQEQRKLKKKPISKKTTNVEIKIAKVRSRHPRCGLNVDDGSTQGRHL